MSNDKLIIYIGEMITSLSKRKDTDDWMRGYINALSDVLDKLKENK